MYLEIRIVMDNAAFEFPNGQEVAHILRDFAAEIEEYDMQPGYGKSLLDINGNWIGSVLVRGE